MPPRTLGLPALRAQLGGMSSQFRDADSLAVAFHASGWDGPATIDVDNRTWRVHACASVLEVRDALSSRDANDPIVILTELTHPELGADVMARLVRRRVFHVDAWEPLLRAFGAQRIDARLNRVPWMADLLLDCTPPDGYPRVASGTLGAATAWRWAVRALLGIATDEPDMRELLEWTLDSGVRSRWATLPVDRAKELARWLAVTIGAHAELPLALIAEGHAALVLPVGLVCGTLFSGTEEPTGICGAAAIRLERLTGGLPVGAVRGRALASAAADMLSRLPADSPLTGQLLVRADDLLADLGAEAEAWRSRWLPRGFQQRLDRFAQALTATLDGADVTASMTRANEALSTVREHTGAAQDAERIVRAEYALRLARYVRTRTVRAPASFAEAVTEYVSDHAFADVARYGLYASESRPALGAAFGAVADRVAATREAVTREFAQLAAAWFAAPTATPGVVPIEDVVASVIAPLAAHAPVLVIVVDGMSAAVADALTDSIKRRGWILIVPTDAPARVSAVGALPSVTEVCRTSLLCGALRKGAAADERSGFASNPALLAQSKPSLPPRLFHKADLGASAHLSSEVAEAIASRDQRLVATVVNAVDDHLLKDDMVRPIWSTDYVPVIGALCDAARAASRAVVVTADHGHLLDLKLTDKAPGDGADRYRRAQPPVRDGELLVSGSRVLAESNRVIVAASERLRYMSRKNGYHGGISPQELVVPVLTFVPEGAVPNQYREVPPDRPAWWDTDAVVAPALEPPVPAGKTGLPLFDSPPLRPAVVQPPSEPAWLTRLMVSEALKSQRQRAARVAVADERLKQLLSTLSSRGGRMTTIAVAERLAIPSGRVTSIVAAVSQLLNFDGYQVIFVEGEEVVLNETLLVTQFELEA